MQARVLRDPTAHEAVPSPPPPDVDGGDTIGAWIGNPSRPEYRCKPPAYEGNAATPSRAAVAR